MTPMRRCVECGGGLVAGGTTRQFGFAVVYWEKEGPRQPKENQPVVTVGKPPQTPEQVLERFKKLLAKEEFRGLGPSGQGVLTISGGVAVFPYHANTMEELI